MVLLFVGSAATGARLASAFSAPWKGTTSQASSYEQAYGCYSIKLTSPTWTAKTGKISTGGSGKATSCPTLPIGYSYSYGIVDSQILIGIPFSATPSTSWVNLSLRVQVAGSAVLPTPGPCPTPSLNSTGGGSIECIMQSEILFAAQAYLYDTGNGSYFFSSSDFYAAVINLEDTDVVSCSSYVCANSYSNFSASVWTNATTNQSLSIGGGCTWKGGDDYCQGNGSGTNAPIGFASGHHYIVQLAAIAYAYAYTQYWTGTCSAAVLGSGPTHGTWVTGLSVT